MLHRFYRSVLFIWDQRSVCFDAEYDRRVFQVGDMKCFRLSYFPIWSNLMASTAVWHLEQFLDSLPKQEGKIHHDLSNLKIHLLLRNNRLQEAEKLIHEEMKHQEDLDQAASYLLLSNLHARQNRNTKGLHTTKSAYQIYCKHEIEHAKTQVMGNLGADWIGHGNLEEARILLHHARRNQKEKNKLGTRSMYQSFSSLSSRSWPRRSISICFKSSCHAKRASDVGLFGLLFFSKVFLYWCVVQMKKVLVLRKAQKIVPDKLMQRLISLYHCYPRKNLILETVF